MSDTGLDVTFLFSYLHLQLVLPIRLILWCGSAEPDLSFHFEADSNPTFHFDADPDPTFHSAADLDPDTVFFMRIRIINNVMLICNTGLQALHCSGVNH